MANQPAKKRAAAVFDDVELVRRALAGDADAFRNIMQRHNRRLYRIARGDRATAPKPRMRCRMLMSQRFPISQAIAVTFSVWRRGSPRITMNEALGRLRRQRSAGQFAPLEETRTEAEIIQFPLSAQHDDPERTMAQRQILRLVEQAIHELPDVYRFVFVTRVIEGMSIEETAQLGIKRKPSRPVCIGHASLCGTS